MKMLFYLLLIVIIEFVIPLTSLHALYDPLTVPNNKYGIHIADTNDIPLLPDLVNSNGGEWGYVTLVIQDTDRSVSKWQNILNQLRREKLIPIVRIATHPVGATWAKPTEDSFNEWADFLGQLVWPIQNRYIVLFNEPNHAKEWGNSIDPIEYATLSVSLAKRLKQRSDNFYLLPAGLDGSAPNGSDTMDESTFLTQVYASVPTFFDVIDGWTSHSYPNPGFSASPQAYGKGTIRHYLWEMQFLRSLGLQKDYEIFITETGWMHRDGIARSNGLLSPETVGSYMQAADTGAWTDPRIVAVTPFIFNYQGEPFDHFSMKMLGTNEYYSHYYSYKNISKIKGEPTQKDSFSPKEPLIPQTLITSSTYAITGTISNIGESILNAQEFTLDLESDASRFTFQPTQIPSLEPGQSGTVSFIMKTPDTTGSYRLSLYASRGSKKSVIESHMVHIIAPPSLTLNVRVGLNNHADNKEVKVLVYDDKSLISKHDHADIQNGSIVVKGLTNIIPGKSYRIVIVVPYYLPRQTIVRLSSENTTVHISAMLPLDFNKDGAFTFKDISTLVTLAPYQALSLLVGR